MQPLVQLSRNKTEDSAAETHVDPVCKMLVQPDAAAATFEHNGTTYYFCAVGCKERFAADPEKYLSSPPVLGAVAGFSSPPGLRRGADA